jgi:class 3 adenylate cyclase/tetratricopeptide (TPR) repeat protein
MTFEEILDQALAMLQRRGRVTYRTLRLQFQLDEEQLEALKDELLFTHPQVHDEAERGLVWTGDPDPTPPVSAPAGTPVPTPLAYTPPYLAEKILTSRSALEGERKQVTVLFADLKGSTELIEGLDPEEARQLLDPALHTMMDAVHRYEGTVNQVLGDGIMALFGAPVAHEDHAVRACYAALAMQAAMRRYAEEVRRSHGLEMQARVGLNSGEVVVRAIGNDLHMDYSAVGQTTHLAARMEQLATPGSIRLTAAALRLAEGLVQVTALGQFPVKGLAEAVEVFELTGASTIRRRLQASAARGLTRFVGRQQELLALQQTLERAGMGHGQVVALVGEAGVGKSRLVYEFVHSHHTPGWLVLESASVSYGKATPYFPVIDLLRRYCHVEEHDDTRTIRAKLTGQILTLDPALQDTLPALLLLPDALPEDSPFLTLDPPQRRQRTLDALKRVFLRESQIQPLLLVFEDLHWIDSETQALLNSLVESLPTIRLLLLVNYRPEYQHSWSGKTYYTQLRLDPLPPASADELLQALLGDDAGLMPLMQLLIARTEGNPFFLEESIRTLVETQVLVGEPGAYRLAQARPTIQVPATVQAVLAARIDRLPPEDKRLLQTAAVIGHEVPLPLLQAIAEAPEDALRRSLAHLQAAEFLYEARLFPELEYTFKHALTHEVAYGSLLQQRRRALHAQIVAALEVLFAARLTEQVERLAHHALRGEVWDKALAYCRQAGEKTMAQSAYREAVSYFEQTLTALAHLPETRATLEQAIDLRFDLRAALFPLGEFERIFGGLREAESLVKTLDDQRRLGWLSVYMCHNLWMTGRPKDALAFGQTARSLGESLGDLQLQVTSNLYFGVALASFGTGQYPRAEELFQRALTLLEGNRSLERFRLPGAPAVAARSFLAWAFADQGRFTEGVAHGQEAIRLAEALDHPYSLAFACWTLAELEITRGEFSGAIRLLERGLALSRQWALTFYLAQHMGSLGYAYALSGRIAEGIPLLEGALEACEGMGLGVGQRLFLAYLGEAYTLTDRLGHALECARRALARAREGGERPQEARALRLLGEIAGRRDPPDDAEGQYRDALALAGELGMRPLVAHCHHSLGTLYATTGQRQQARAALSAAIDLYRALDMTFWLPQAEAALAQVEG